MCCYALFHAFNEFHQFSVSLSSCISSVVLVVVGNKLSKKENKKQKKCLMNMNACYPYFIAIVIQ